MKISEIITDKYKLRMPPTVYYELLADVVEVEEEQEPCEDAISRKALIDVFRTTEDAEHATWTLKGIEDEINEMPSVTPIRPKGHWKADYKGCYRKTCSNCGIFNNSKYKNFCPNCGARMVEPQESEDKISRSVIEDIKAEIKQIIINGQIDEHTSFIRTGEQVKTMVLDIIDK